MFSLTGEQRRRIEQREVCAVGSDELGAVAVVGRPDGDHVVVAVDSQGVLHRTPDGTWERRAVLDAEPTDLRGPSWPIYGLYVPLAVVVVAGAAALVHRRRRRQWAREVALVGVAGGASLFVVGGGLGAFGFDYAIVGPVIAVLSVLVFVASLVAPVREHVMRQLRPASRSTRPPPRIPPPPATG